MPADPNKVNSLQLVYTKPTPIYKEDKAVIEALTGLVGGEEAYATDTGEWGHYDFANTEWVWHGTGGGGAVDSVNGYTGIVVLDPDDLDDSGTTNKFTTSAEISKLAGIEAGADVTDIANVGSALNSASADTPLDADTFFFWDAVDAIIKEITWANIKATLQTFFDAIYLALGGWQSVSQTFTYASADDPVYQIYVSGDVTANADYKLGNKIKCTNNSTTFYGFIVKVGAYDGGNNRTPVDIYGGTDYDLANSAITAPYISKIKSPDGFPMNPDKWTYVASNTSNNSQATPTANVWYNVGGFSINIPIGCWLVIKDCLGQVTHSPAVPSSASIRTTLSTANNSMSDPDFHSVDIASMPAGTSLQNYSAQLKEKILNLTSKTPYYLNILTGLSGTTSISIRGDIATTYIKVVCAYL